MELEKIDERALLQSSLILEERDEAKRCMLRFVRLIASVDGQTYAVGIQDNTNPWLSSFSSLYLSLWCLLQREDSRPPRFQALHL
jgi:hypothetical protein